MKFKDPIIEEHQGIRVVRDDLLPGGTKARFIYKMFETCEELVYASPQEGGAQTGLSIAARVLKRKFTLFVAMRKIPHERVALSEKLGANVVKVKPGYLSTVQARARDYARRARLFDRRVVHDLGFGLESDDAIMALAEAAIKIPRPRELWFSAGSGTLAKGLARAWPDVPRFAVQVGHVLGPNDVGGAMITRCPLAFSEKEEELPPFPSDLHYDAKAWKALRIDLSRRESPNRDGITFWNVAGPSSEYEKYCDNATIEAFRAETSPRGSSAGVVQAAP